jgi:alginate O-acetyltransferase complex protein AlgI
MPMLFNSYTYILVFLPAALIVFHALRRMRLHRSSLLSLVLCSLVFYAWWNPVYLLLLVPLTLGNFAIAIRIARARVNQPTLARALMIAGVTGNLAVLGYFKYANFLVENVDSLFGLDWVLAGVVLPLGISFFTFQKIAFVVDSYRGKVDRYDLLEFALFVSFFPQLIAGPIVHHSEVMPQFRQPSPVLNELFPMGLTIFVFGLAKKVLLADSAARYATPAFDAAAAGDPLGMWGAWNGVLAYTVQLYFDFSGYTDMAIGAALLFGIRLPLNFASPYKAQNIIDFWRRWHMTLSRLLRDYLYVPLGGNRHGEARRYANLLVTMVLGGLWHGAAWTFVFWGALHGAYLTVNHLWRTIRSRLPFLPSVPSRIELLAGSVLTFLAVVVGWVFFRASDFAAAVNMLTAMAGVHGLIAGTPGVHVVAGGTAIDSVSATLFIGSLLLLCWLSPNTQEIARYHGPAGTDTPQSAPDALLPWRPTPAWGAAVACLFALALMNLSRVSEFLYFQF